MPNLNVGIHTVAAGLALIQAALTCVLFYRLRSVYKSVDARRSLASLYFLRIHRVCIVAMTVLQLIRCIDPFASLGIMPYAFVHSLQILVTLTVYFEYCCTSYVLMETLYACVLKKAPRYLSIAATILPLSYIGVGVVMFIVESSVANPKQWMDAIAGWFFVLVIGANLVTYNVCGLLLIRVLRHHQQTGLALVEEISASKSASPFNIVIKKTIRSMVILTTPSLIALIMTVSPAIGFSNNLPPAPYDPHALTWVTQAIIIVQLILGLTFTRSIWISKTVFEAEMMATKAEGARTSSKTLSRADLKEKSRRTSQLPMGSTSSQSSHSDVEMGDSPAPAKSERLVIQAECAPVPHLKGDLKSLVQHEANPISVLVGDADSPQNSVVQQKADMV